MSVYERDVRMEAAVLMVQNALNSVIGAYCTKLELDYEDLAAINVRVANILEKGTAFDKTFTWEIVPVDHGNMSSVQAVVAYRDVVDRLGALDDA